MFKTAGVILVSDLFLQSADDHALKNILALLNDLNYFVKKVSVLHSNEGIICNELNTLAKQFDIVIVAGKLSDIIFKALAKLTVQELTTNLKFKMILDEFHEVHTYQLPITAKILTGNDLIYPIVHVQTIFVLNENYLRDQLGILHEHLKQYRLPAVYSKVIHIQMNGNMIEILDRMKNTSIKTICQENGTVLSIILESTCFEDVIEFEKGIQHDFRAHFINSCIVNNISCNIYTDSDDQIRQALEAIEKCFNDYGPENVFLSFNGGKDCTVLLHLIHTVLSVKYPDYKEPIVCLYIKSENAFPEQDKFISQCKVYFNLELISVVQNIKEGLREILSLKPNLAACFMGTRRTDPFSSDLKVFQMTDHNWPHVMRVSPLLNWHYSDIWDYLLYYKIPYCKLYDMGYTSLGNASNTIRNPSLLYNDIYHDTEVYLPAYKMLNENGERSGRNI